MKTVSSVRYRKSVYALALATSLWSACGVTSDEKISCTDDNSCATAIVSVSIDWTQIPPEETQCGGALYRLEQTNHLGDLFIAWFDRWPPPKYKEGLYGGALILPLVDLRFEQKAPISDSPLGSGLRPGGVAGPADESTTWWFTAFYRPRTLYSTITTALPEPYIEPGDFVSSGFCQENCDKPSGASSLVVDHPGIITTEVNLVINSVYRPADQPLSTECQTP